MKKKIFSVFILALFLMTILASAVFAQTGNIGDDMFGEKGIFSTLVTGLAKFINQLATLQFTMPIKWPGIENQQTNMLTLILVFIVLFALVYPTAGFIPLFKNGTSTGSRKTFSVALSMLITFFSPIPILLSTTMMSYLSNLIQIGLVVLFILGFWWMIRKTGTGFGSINANSGKLAANNAKVQNDNRKIRREVGMETAMDGREDRSLTELDGIDRNAIANTRDIEQKWRRIQTDLAQMGGLRTELAMQRGQQILSVIANVMGEESNETQIQERINNITGLLAKESVEELAGLKNITKALRDRVKASMGTGTTDAAANARINQAIRNAQQVLTMIKQIEKMNASDLQYESKVRDISRQVVQRVQSADFKGAGALINTIIAEIQKETGYLAQIDQIILRVRPLLTAEVQEVHSLLR